jgi:phosphoglycolate phosphatase
MPKHIYFDLDGTLTDPYEGISRCIVYAVEKLGFPVPSDDYLHSCIGPPLYETFPQLVGEELTLRAVDLYRERFDEIGWLENKPYDGIHDALARVAASGCTMYVATSKPRIAAARIIEHFDFGQYFERVFGCELDGTRANKTDLLAFAIEENPAATSRTMIGDRKHDLIGAIANDIEPVGVAYGYGTTDELTAAGAVSIAEAPADIPQLLLHLSDPDQRERSQQ